ncbi:MAG TPA: patatin family protein [Spirochaetota bacterium]
MEKGKKKKVKCALIVEGGAMRGIFSTGVLDAFIKENFYPFDLAIGVSAGSTNIAAYLAKMFERNYRVYTDYSLRKEFINIWKFFRGKHLIDLDWLWDITIREVKLDIKKIVKGKTTFLIGLTDVDSGTAVYMEPTEKNLETALKASSALPVLYRDFISVDGKEYTDGGLSDPIPVREAYRLGARKIVVLRSRPYDHVVDTGQDTFLARIFMRKHPKLLKVILERPRVYNEALDFVRNPPRGVEIIEVNPPKGFRTRRLTKDVEMLMKDYRHGFEAGCKLISQWKTKA